MAEPLAVALHATRRAGSLMGKRVLVSGSGPIGALVVSRGAARRRRRDRRHRHRRRRARLRRAHRRDRAINVARAPEALDRL